MSPGNKEADMRREPSFHVGGCQRQSDVIASALHSQVPLEQLQVPADQVLRRSCYLRETINKGLVVVKLKFLLTTNILVIKIHSGLVAHALTLTPALGILRQEDLSELESSLLLNVPGQPGLHNKTMTQK